MEVGGQVRFLIDTPKALANCSPGLELATTRDHVNDHTNTESVRPVQR
jgi:hypothetical protein